MTEDELNKLSIDALFDILMQSTRELINLVHTEFKEEYMAKKEEVELLQRIIFAKRAQEKPG